MDLPTTMSRSAARFAAIIPAAALEDRYRLSRSEPNVRSPTPATGCVTHPTVRSSKAAAISSR